MPSISGHEVCERNEACDTIHFSAIAPNLFDLSKQELLPFNLLKVPHRRVLLTRHAFNQWTRTSTNGPK
ncbi:hypothetical protein CHS0354_025986 [Potamilus streckersoni]|uniref:Uncharacterized protein n=1 Tax=Potamilus streckersoni TaxID=2493646 RepID=A0AAE0W7T9_9BIVA|nr:hypothetical protein CHS0354_025986 [Potamilus streckersoni]